MIAWLVSFSPSQRLDLKVTLIVMLVALGLILGMASYIRTWRHSVALDCKGVRGLPVTGTLRLPGA